MNVKYRHGFEVPTEELCTRLDELSNAVTKGRDAINREFYMSIPALHHIDADLVLSEASMRIKAMNKRIGELTLQLAEKI